MTNLLKRLIPRRSFCSMNRACLQFLTLLVLSRSFSFGVQKIVKTGNSAVTRFLSFSFLSFLFRYFNRR